jgi:hypothetical protein
MKHHLFSKTLACAGMSLLAVSCQSSSKVAEQASLPSGEWISESCESFPNQDGSKTYFHRHFIFEGKKWLINFNTFGDETCKTQLLNVKVGGIMRPSDTSSKVPGATNVFFTIDQREITPVGAGVLGWLNGGEKGVCDQKGWEVGRAKNILESGCAALGSPTAQQCPGEYDLIKWNGEKLYLGQRTQKMCEKDNWPVAANSVALIRKK